ncbi:hypothetical protein P5673_001059 [Acropora cervicornis]|uniref:G-protein coupled receptors family 1 profile domain-containing protein n=1 Tax=Acropora cervicornis TaxID=6130 RepID=A0AAD9VGB0_ACRCE|nr:hypothetical protein P5673_001059 [Acropora cervicornis]
MLSLEAFTNIFCSQEFTRALDNQIICFSVINTVLAITAIVGNTLILMALHKEISLHRPSKVLIRNLVASDLCVGFAELATVAQWISILQERWQICGCFFLAHSMISITSIAVSLWTLAAISVDRLLALLLGLSDNGRIDKDNNVFDNIHLLLHNNFLQVAKATDSCS